MTDAATTRETADLYKNPAETNTSAEHVKTADHAELARLAEAAEPYWRAANLACGGNPIAVDLVATFVGAMSPSVCSALLSEIAALRGDLTVSRDDLDQLQAHFRQRDREATQAERQRDEAVGLLRESLAPGSFEGETKINARIRAFLANQGADHD